LHFSITLFIVEPIMLHFLTLDVEVIVKVTG